MKNTVEHWEQGSDYHWIDNSVDSVPHPLFEKARFYGSGRDAIRALIQHGQHQRGWKRIWLPSYYCQEVITAILSTDIMVALYFDKPGRAFTRFNFGDLKHGDAILQLNYFGLRSKPPFILDVTSAIDIIEDHTHDPWSSWSLNSKADWCLASLRKTLPLPSGGILWSPRRHKLPEEVPVSSQRENASLQKFTSMVLKQRYIAGYNIDKTIFRALASASEQQIAAGPISGMPLWVKSLLLTLPIDEWRNQRRENYLTIYHAINDISTLIVLSPDDIQETCPYACIFLFGSIDQRNYIRMRLIESNIYPAILWSLNKTFSQLISGEISKQDYQFSDRMLSIHCDMRYQQDTMLYIAKTIRSFIEEYTTL